MADGWIEPDWIDPDWIETDDELSFLAWGPQNLRGMTAAGAANALDLIYGQVPGPYSDRAIFWIYNWMGLRLWGTQAIRDSVIVGDIGRYSTLLEVEDIHLSTTPLSGDLIGSLGMSEKPRFSVVLSNHDRQFSRLIANEAMLLMPAGLSIDYGNHVLLLVAGQITRLRLWNRKAFIEVGEP